VAVGGGAPPAHVIDGALDAGMTPVASCGGRDLHADYDGESLYLAAPAASGGVDHFILLARTENALRGAPWAKSGSAAGWDHFLAGEGDNGWIGWFDAAESVVGTPAFEKAQGAWLEGRIDVAAVYGTAPAAIRVAFAAYATANGGALQSQAPCGDGNGNLEATEWIEVRPHGPVAVEPRATPPRGIGIRPLSRNPTAEFLRARIDAGSSTDVEVELVDVAGRRLALLHDGPAHGGFEVAADLRRLRLSPGIVLLVARSNGERATRRFALVR
jgi:hypothetical protein